MGALCRTTPEEGWDSFIAGIKEGRFTVDVEDPQGVFEGKFSDGASEEAIKGKCDEKTIEFWRPAQGPRFHYSGSFAGDRHIRPGRRSDMPALREEAQADEEWEAIKTTTKTDDSRA